MKELITGIILLLLNVSVNAQKVTIGREVKMLALGDSYTIGASVDISGRWPHQFVDELRELGVSASYPDYIATTGWTTRNLIQGISSSYDNAKVYNLVSILIGVNNQYQGLPIEDFEPDLKEIIDFALGLTGQDPSRLMILSIPDYAFTPFGGGSTFISQEIDAYNAIKKRVAGEYEIPYFDITPVSREGLNNPSLVARDGLHPSEIQYGLWVKEIIPRLRVDLTSLSRNKIQFQDDRISITPNPARETLQIVSAVDIDRIRIYNSIGSLVSEQKITGLPGNTDISHLGSGIYTVLFFHEDDICISHKKLIVTAE